MEEAAPQACGYVEGMELDDFLRDKRTQQALILNLVIGELWGAMGTGSNGDGCPFASFPQIRLTHSVAADTTMRSWCAMATIARPPFLWRTGNLAEYRVGRDSSEKQPIRR